MKLMPSFIDQNFHIPFEVGSNSREVSVINVESRPGTASTADSLDDEGLFERERRRLHLEFLKEKVMFKLVFLCIFVRL